jgi:hypothetical protein
MSFNIARSLMKTMDSDLWQIQTSLAGGSRGAPFDLASYLDQHSGVLETGVEPLLRILRYGIFKGNQLKQAKKAFRKALVGRFHSLGDNCEFGFVQRQFAAEPIDLFRFSGSSIAGLNEALSSRLEGFAELNNLSLEFEGHYERGHPQIMTIVPVYGFKFHGGDIPLHTIFEDMKVLQWKRLNLLARKLFEDLEDADRIFVHKSHATRAEVDQLVSILRGFGPNRVLWVTLAEPGKPPGTVEPIYEGLMRGYIERFATPEAIGDFEQATWLKICCEALRVDEQSRA